MKYIMTLNYFLSLLILSVEALTHILSQSQSLAITFALLAKLQLTQLEPKRHMCMQRSSANADLFKQKMKSQKTSLRTFDSSPPPPSLHC